MLARLVLALALVLTGAGLPAVPSALGAGSSDQAARPAVVPVDGVVGEEPAGDVSVDEVELVVPATTDDGTVVAAPAPAVEPEALVADDVVAGGRVATEVLETEGFQTLGVTWPGDVAVDALALEVRTRDADGTWSGWTPLEQSDDAPDAGTADAASAARGGTDPLWVGDAVAVQVAVPAGGEAGPADMALALVDVPQSPVDAVDVLATGDATVVDAGYVDAAVNVAAAPRVITRAEWGARAQACEPSVASGLVGAVVHHTAGLNTYSTVAEAMAQIRGDQAYHMDGRGWCDLGYNFVVDKWGNIYEGRAKSLTEPVIGVHAGGFNTGTVGVSMLGDYSTVTPPAATQEAVARILAFRLGAYSLNPAGSFTFHTLGGENSRFAAGSDVPLPVIFGHRDVGQTACPGNAGYGTLGWVRARATALSVATPLVQALYKDMLGRGVDPVGLAGWSDALSNGTSAGQLAGYIAVSEEYATTAVRQAYLDVLRREPEAGGLRNWVNAVMGGMLRPEDLRGALIASEEYYIRSGSTPAGYVTRLYQDILKRDPQAAERDAWVTDLATRGRGVVSHGVWKSLESARLRVDEAYRLYLGRGGDPTGLGQWAPVLQARGEGALRSAIVDSDEYRRRAMDRF